MTLAKFAMNDLAAPILAGIITGVTGSRLP
ncbi:type I toxin-antitoxin system toxin Ldr family protein [Escherichia coli]